MPTYYFGLAELNPRTIGYQPVGVAVAQFDRSRFDALAVPARKDRNDTFIALFLQKRLCVSPKRSNYDPAKRASPTAAVEWWNSFIVSMLQSPKRWMENLQNFNQASLDGAKWRFLNSQFQKPDCL